MSIRDELKTIAILAAPIALAQFGMTALGLVDVAVLGHASTTELGGASIGRSINFIGVALPFGAATALEPLASQAIGAREPDEAWRAFLASLLAGALLWIPCALLASASTWLLGPLGIAPELITPARAFLFPSLPGMLFFGLFVASKSFLQANKRTMPSLVSAILANAVNFIVCNVLVRGDDALAAVSLPPMGLPRLGAFGAGLASTIACFVLAAPALFAAWRLRPRHARISAKRLPLRKVLTLATPIGFQLLAEIGVFSVVAVLAGRLGGVAVSAHQIAVGLASFTFMGALGVSGATAVRVGHAIGERRSARVAGLTGIALGAAFMGGCALVFLTIPEQLMRLFTVDEAIVALGARLLAIAAAFQLFDGVQVVSAGALRGAADVRFSFLANLGAHWFIGFPLAILFGFKLGLGARGLWIGLLVGLMVVAALLAWRFIIIARRPIARA